MALIENKVVKSPAQIEREWRDKELLAWNDQRGLWSVRYKDAVEKYMQELADYTDHPMFPQCDRPERPLTEKGRSILL